MLPKYAGPMQWHPAGEPMAPSAKPLTNPWRLHAAGSLARRLGFTPEIATLHQARREGVL